MVSVRFAQALRYTAKIADFMFLQLTYEDEKIVQRFVALYYPGGYESKTLIDKINTIKNEENNDNLFTPVESN